MQVIPIPLLLTVCICTANFLQAQELKTEALKVTAIQPPPTETVTNKPSPTPELKSMNGIAPQQQPHLLLLQINQRHKM